MANKIPRRKLKIYKSSNGNSLKHRRWGVTEEETVSAQTVHYVLLITLNCICVCIGCTSAIITFNGYIAGIISIEKHTMFPIMINFSHNLIKHYSLLPKSLCIDFAVILYEMKIIIYNYMYNENKTINHI
jgi:hypothetical protein